MPEATLAKPIPRPSPAPVEKRPALQAAVNAPVETGELPMFLRSSWQEDEGGGVATLAPESEHVVEHEAEHAEERQLEHESIHEPEAIATPGARALEESAPEIAAAPEAQAVEEPLEATTSEEEVVTPEAEAQTATESTPPAEAEAASPETDLANTTPAEASETRIVEAPESPVKAAILEQTALIRADSAAKREEVRAVAASRRFEVSLHFAFARANISSFVESNIAAAERFFAAKRAELSSLAAVATLTVFGIVQDAIQKVESSAQHVEGLLTGVVQSASEIISGAVGGIARRVTGVLNSVPLPDLPGLDTARQMITSVGDRALNVVTGAVNGVAGMIQSSLDIGMRVVRTVMQGVSAVLGQVLTRTHTAITSAIDLAYGIIANAIFLVGLGLRGVLNMVVMPVLERAESATVTAITALERAVIEQIRANEALHLAALAGTADPEGDQTSGPVVEVPGIDVMLDVIRQIGTNAIRNNQTIIYAFVQKVVEFIPLLFGSVQTAMLTVVSHIATRTAELLQTITLMAGSATLNLLRLMGGTITMVQTTLERFMSIGASVRDFIANLVGNPVRQVADFVQSMLQRVRSAAERIIDSLIRSIIGGGTGLLFDPGPAPIPIPIPIPVPTPTPIPTPAPIPTPVPSPSPSPDWLKIAIIVVIVLAILILLYLLWKWVTKPRLPPPPKKPRGIEFDKETHYSISYSVPLENVDIQASKGEQLIFGVEATDKDRQRPIGGTVWTDIDPGLGPYDVVYTVSNDASFDAAGSGKTTHIDPTLQSRNVFLFIDAAWAGSKITVSAQLKDKAAAAVAPDIGTTQDTDDTISWTIVTRANAAPTSLTRTGGVGAVFTPAPAIYTYQAEPEINPPGRPNYEKQTVLESFPPGSRANGFVMADLKTSWKLANPTLNTPDKVSAFLFDAGSNGTFVLDSNDEMSDRHDGFGPTDPFEPAALSRATGVGYEIDQTYSCEGNTIGTALVERRFSTSTGLRIRKTGP